MAKNKKKESAEIIETFNPPSTTFLYIQKEPSAFNGYVRVRKYRITIEMVDEPIEVIQQRLQELWDKCDNMHHYDPLKNEAKKYHYELQGGFGSKRTKKN